MGSFSEIFNDFIEGVQIIDQEMKYFYVNETVIDHAKKSREELLGRKVTEVFPGIEETKLYKRIQEVLKNQNPQSFVNKFHYEDGSIGWFDLRMQPIEEGVLILSNDITEKKAVAQHKLQNQKIQELGKVAASVAHDFNNKLTTIEMAYLALKKKCGENDTDIKKTLELLGMAVTSSEELVHQFTDFVRLEVDQIESCDLRTFFPQYLPQYKLLTKERGIEIETHLTSSPLNVSLPKSQLDQILLNLVVNAKDAMPKEREGKITIKTEMYDLSGLTGTHPLLLKEGQYALITFSDNGSGMSEETVKKAFDFSFTTKNEGEGTGLGLATVKKIIYQALGAIELKSIPDEGTTFSIYLPLVS